MAPRSQPLPQPMTESARDARKANFCELCQKGYARANEYETHLVSYDHTHRQRLKEMRELTRDANAASRRARSGEMQELSRIDLPHKVAGAKKKKKPVFKSVMSNPGTDPLVPKAPAADAMADGVTDMAIERSPAAATTAEDDGQEEEVRFYDPADPSGAVSNGWADQAYDPEDPIVSSEKDLKELMTRGLTVGPNGGLAWA